ncbi:hypothetical protein ABIB57_005216 [Devosia sp. UYZn731]|uniref:hypothetical protein n=1 Tax=Devosia sp. UYZn731 TaxID=3156345 RepID=UPI003397D4C0
MRAVKIALIAGLVLASGSSVFAQDAMGTMMMMKSGESVAIMGDGHMGTMMIDDAMMAEMMKTAKPVTGCMMFMTGADGKTYMMDTSSADAMATCEKMAK